MKYLLFIILVTQLGACQNKHIEKPPIESKNMQTTQHIKTTFQWSEGLNAPLGYPVSVYRGGLELSSGFVGLSGLATASGFGGWGAEGNGMSNGIKSLPKRINCIWLSYAEDCMYEINCDVDYEKTLKLFNEGFIDSNRKRGRKMDTYNKIMVGFAPGGVVVLWASGGDKKVEIGRYQGEKTIVSPEEIAKLDSHEKLFFDPAMRKHVMDNPRIVPPEVQKLNKNKPIPFGLWDIYREKHSWRPIFSIPDEGKMNDRVRIEKYNGENETLLYEEFYDNKFAARAIPQRINFGYWDKNGQGYGCNVILNESEIFDAFNKLSKEESGGNLELLLKTNKTNSFIVVSLKGKQNEIALIKSTIEVFESSKLTKEFKVE
ncbi:DUF2931 family protein [Flavobacterium ardleyense]|uniref:DUF2931 family protein n=1 Tax=Flavobacterium ardleyense TaxID=2038737 RepID=A0ABW5ZAQ8_9FLAO